MGKFLPGRTELLILQMLRDEPSGMYGLEFVKASGGKLKRGTAYVTLGRMEDNGFVRSKLDRSTSHPGLPRPRYVLTGVGQKALEAAELVGMRALGA